MSSINSALLGLYGITPDLGSGALLSGATVRKTPTAPWAATAAKTEPSALVRAALGGRKFIDVSAAQLDVKNANQDYKRLFALHQGLETLKALASRADEKGVSAAETARLEAAFQKGLAELSKFLSADDFDSIRLAREAATVDAKSTVGTQRPNYTYVTAPVHKGLMTEAASALQGDVRFSMTVGRLAGDVTIDIDLADMGAMPRSLPNVVSHINAKLEAAGVETRLSTQLIKGEPRTLKVGSRTLTLPAEVDSWAFSIKATALESVSFGAPDAADGVFVVQGSGHKGLTQLSKFQSDTGVTGTGPPAAEVRPGETLWVEGRALQTTMDAGIDRVTASAAGPDGSLFVLAEADATIDGQTLKGRRDAVLMKYDSAGQLVYTRTLGAADQATARALSVSADGKVAIVGSVVGALDNGQAGASATLSDSYVAVFDADGAELWTQRRGARLEDEALGVAFAEDGSVHVVGRARSGMTGALGVGGWDGYLQSFSAAGLSTSTVQFGTVGDDAASSIAVKDGVIVTAGSENGQAVLRRFEIQPGEPTLTQVRSLGALSGAISSVHIDGGRVLVAGSTTNAALEAGTITNAHAGGADAFVARLDLSLAADAADRVTYIGGSGKEGPPVATVAGGKVWISGQTNIAGVVGKETAGGRLTRLDADTGVIEWDRTLLGESGYSTPMAIAVSVGGASVLDRLGLPQGKIDFTDSKRIVDATSARAGDQFYLDLGGGRLKAVAVAADDTLATLAKKIAAASSNRVKAEAAKSGDQDILKITLRDGRDPIEIVAGTLGRDALAGLGLAQTLVKGSAAPRDDRSVFALKLPAGLSIASKAGIKEAVSALAVTSLQLRSAYRELSNRDQPASANITGEAPAYISAQIANYQSALQRLGGG